MGTDRHMAVDLLNDLAETCIMQGDLTEARKYLRHACEIQACQANDLSEAGHAKTVALDGLVRLRSGDGTGASRKFAHAIKMLEAAYGPIFPQIAEVLTYIGEYLHKVAHDLNGAILRYLKAVVLFEEAYGLKHAGIVNALERIGSIYVEKGNRLEAKHYFDYVIAISAARNDRDNPAVTIPRLIRLRGTAGAWANPESFEREHERRLSKVHALFGHESAQSTEALRYHESLGGFVSDARKLSRVRRFVTISVPILLLLTPVVYFWARSRNPRMVGSLTPYVIAVLIFTIGLYVLNLWRFWRARKSWPLLYVGEEGELRKYGKLEGEGLVPDALATFWYYRYKGDNFAKLAEADIWLIFNDPRRSLKLIEQVLKSSPGEASVLRRRAHALLDQAEHGGHDLARSAGAALSDLDQAARTEPSSFGELLRARALSLLERGEAPPGTIARPSADGQDGK